jgi:hypothetical protein
MTGALVALFYMLIAMLGGVSALCFIMAFRGRAS